MRSLELRAGFSATALFLMASAVCLPGQALAQGFDPALVKDLQSQLGAGTNNIPQPRSTSRNESSSPVQVPGARIDTMEEQELRRAVARQQVREYYRPSEIEADYRRRLNSTELRQFGYDFFQSAAPPSGVRTGAISDDYVLGIGDELEVNFRGATNRSYTVRVDRDGQVIVGDLRPVQAAGRSLGSVRGELAAETRRTILATDIFISVGEVRAVSVFVGGEVERPGQINLTSASDIGTALAQAGGVRRSGSLRRVRVVRAGGGTVEVDLYGLLGIGAPPRVQLRDGDRVIVPVIGQTIAVTGSVARPAIYEIRGTASMGSVVDFAGGSIRQRGATIVVGRIDGNGVETFIRPGTALAAQGGDSIQVLGGSAGGVSGRVQMAGHVDNPGPRPLIAAGTVAELVGSPQDLRSDSYQLAAVLMRRDASSGARLLQVVNLAQELRDPVSTPLQSEDKLFIFSRADIAFMNSSAVRQIVLGQTNSRPQCRSLERLETLVQDTESSRFNSVTRGGFVVVSEKGATLGAVNAALTQSSKLATEQAVSGDAETNTNTEYADRPEQLCPTIFEEEPDLLPVLMEHSISVGGSVRRPGAYPAGGLVTARDLSLVAEGLLAGSRELMLDINRTTPGPVERLDVDASHSLMTVTQLSAGDDIRFNAQQPMFEGSAILLSGEVARPGLYSIRRGEKLSELFARAGGLTDEGYAYGTVFTRRSVKEAQEEGFRRTAREMNNSLLAIAARSNQSGADLAGAAALIESLSRTEAAGRIVVEADPRVLTLRPDLDTILEAGDSIFVPKRPNYVLALGDVNNPGALQFVNGKSATSYVSDAGGTLASADGKRAFIVLPNGSAQPMRVGGGASTPPPGTTIIIPKNIDPLYRLSIVRDVTAIIAQLATSVATVAVLATR